MRYEIRLAAPQGEIVPLLAVADTKAGFRATAGGTDFHKPAYARSFKRFADDLLREAKFGRLKVCDQWGAPGEADALIADAMQRGDLLVYSRYLVEPDWERLHRENAPVKPGVWNLTHLDLGPSEVDWTRAHLSALATTLKWLNEWGESRGDEFTVSCEGVEWLDERGLQPPSRKVASSDSGRPPGAPDAAVTEPLPQRKPLMQSNRERVLKALRDAGYDSGALKPLRNGLACPAKSAARAGAGLTEGAFEHAWKALLRDGDVKRRP